MRTGLRRKFRTAMATVGATALLMVSFGVTQAALPPGVTDAPSVAMKDKATIVLFANLQAPSNPCTPQALGFQAGQMGCALSHPVAVRPWADKPIYSGFDGNGAILDTLWTGSHVNALYLGGNMLFVADAKMMGKGWVSRDSLNLDTSVT